ncbi:SIS domain-containing protein [Atopobium sp. oral taxon 810]|uniref:SIS domain-containing protein n=1 Tax=Atopobium sp. oral taxon 810 TaxID=712158 RepID=UPI0003965DD6|nr:SIS domain-containing protein [Atopobium sp. oral taxon 810]ERI06045.1 SIS domain protein [Atopobium sp. oral taxon 810 str. F0209]
MNIHEIIEAVIAEKSAIKQVYWVACGGSIIDLYPAHCLMQTESLTAESGYYTAREFTTMVPRRLGEQSLVVLCSHSGGTPEVMAAGELACSKGASVIALTNKAGSAIDSAKWLCWVYAWGHEVPTAEIPLGIGLRLAAEVINQQDEYVDYTALQQGLRQIDEIIATDRIKINNEMSEQFAALCKGHPFFYILGSGPTFSQTYGFAICSLMEMQWQHCSYIHTAEYFHGPFECTEPGVFYFLQMSDGAHRDMDQRALDFLQTHTDTLMVLDAKDYGMDAIDVSVRDYLEPAMFYMMNCELRAARGRLFNHDPDIRRYMGKVSY